MELQAILNSFTTVLEKYANTIHQVLDDEAIEKNIDWKDKPGKAAYLIEVAERLNNAAGRYLDAARRLHAMIESETIPGPTSR